MSLHPPQERPAASLSDNPFQKATLLTKRVKLLVYGDSGSGKTTLSLQFPRPALIDLEGGADLYGDKFEFDVFRCTTADEVMHAVTWLATHRHPYRTVIVDPISVYWDHLQKKWSDIFLLRNKGAKGYRYEYFDMGPREWQSVKAENKDLLRRLSALDVNLIVTARQKPLYADGAFMRVAGETFDGEKNLGYAFDSVVQLYRDPKGRFLARVQKDRTGRLPSEPFPCTYQAFVDAFGIEALTRPSRIGQGDQNPPARVVPVPPESGPCAGEGAQ